MASTPSPVPGGDLMTTLMKLVAPRRGVSVVERIVWYTA